MFLLSRSTCAVLKGSRYFECLDEFGSNTSKRHQHGLGGRFDKAQSWSLFHHKRRRRWTILADFRNVWHYPHIQRMNKGDNTKGKFRFLWRFDKKSRLNNSSSKIRIIIMKTVLDISSYEYTNIWHQPLTIFVLLPRARIIFSFRCDFIFVKMARHFLRISWQNVLEWLF